MIFKAALVLIVFFFLIFHFTKFANSKFGQKYPGRMAFCGVLLYGVGFIGAIMLIHAFRQ